MNIRDTIAAVNQMQADGVIARRAIVARHGLGLAWGRFVDQFLSDPL